MTIMWVVLAVLVLLVLYFIGTYNQLVAARQNVRESWSAIETELRRRFDLIPNLVETVKGYASHEHSTLEAVITARNKGIASGTPQGAAEAANQLSGALGKLIALSEAYPDLKANQNFNQLQAELGETETRISQARRFYNANVREFNTTIESFPACLVANTGGFRPEVYFGIDNADAFEPVKINFNSSESGSGEGSSIKLKTSDKIQDRE